MPDQSDVPEADAAVPSGAAAPDTAEAPRAPAGGSGMINGQLTDAVSAINTLLLGEAPSSAAAMLGLASANTVALSMYNAVARQQSDAALASAAIAATCARMIGTQGVAAAPFPGDALVAAAEGQARAAIQILKTQGAQAGDASSPAAEALARLVAEARAATPAEAPSARGARRGGKSG
jgi:hypothetical protein